MATPVQIAADQLFNQVLPKSGQSDRECVEEDLPFGFGNPSSRNQHKYQRTPAHRRRGMEARGV